MKIQELRIGNYVKGTFTNFCEDEAPQNECVCEIVILDETAQSGFTKWANSIEEKGKFVEEWDRLDGLILNDEWLLKFGWKYNNITNRYELDDWRFYIAKPANYDGFLLCEGSTVITDRLKYVHQLQNLYFALTGEELVLSGA